MTVATPIEKPLPPAVIRWTVLVLVSIAMFGNYYVYDSIGPLADTLQRMLGFTDTQIGTLNAIYSFPNIVMVLIGGIIVDRIGTRLSILVFTAVCLLGAVLTAISRSFVVMAAGRLVFGLGAESMIVAITAALGQWFVGRQLGFAFGLNLCIARAGSYAADLSPTWAKSFYASGWQRAAADLGGVLRGQPGGGRRLLDPRAGRRGALRAQPAARRPTASCGATSGASTAPTGTSSASASPSTRSSSPSAAPSPSSTSSTPTACRCRTPGRSTATSSWRPSSPRRCSV